MTPETNLSESAPVPPPVAYDPASETYRVRFEPGESPPIGFAIITAIASIEDVDPIDVPLRLYDFIDLDALETLFRSRTDGSPTGKCRVEFDFGPYDVRVQANGSITIDPRRRR